MEEGKMILSFPYAYIGSGRNTLTSFRQHTLPGQNTHALQDNGISSALREAAGHHTW